MTVSLDSAGNVTVVNEVHEAKAASPMLLRVSGSECYSLSCSLTSLLSYLAVAYLLSYLVMAAGRVSSTRAVQPAPC
eukprot:scaffold20864_cov72-Phaeocystis_antarctica.AAC.7